MHRMFRALAGRGVASLWVCVMCLFVALEPRVGLAQAGDEDEAYKAMVGAAVQEFAAGNWAEARALFKRAHDIDPSARTLRGMGMAAYELRMYVPALRELEGALRDTRKPLDAEQVQQAQQLIKLASAFVGRYRVVLEPPDTAARIDGREPQYEPGNVLLLELGAHELSGLAPGHEAGAVKFRTEGGEDKELKLRLLPEGQAGPEPASPPVPQSMQSSSSGGPNLAPWAWVMVGTTAIFGGTAGAMWGVASSKYASLEEGCGAARGCSEEEIDNSGVQTLDLLTNVFIGLAGASALTAVVLFIVDAGQNDKDSSVSVNVGPTSLVVDGRF